MAKEIMKTHDIIFSNRPQILVAKVAYNAKDIAFSPCGSYWRQLRKKDVQRRAISLQARAMFQVHKGRGARAALGEKCIHQQEFICIIEEAVHLSGGLCLADLYPSITWLQMFSVVKAKSE
ncbi:Cytochrome P450 71D9 [Glycine soja]|uniref:Cytochrome P450 71D9 n=1 Tax=Glycine soja TaxID=3848 RepID=A0A0B2PM28_GLYSO|nr:Cytochrome P450 71D9 [Glycine soja]